MTGEATLEGPASPQSPVPWNGPVSHVALQGELRRLPPRPFLRVLQAITLFTFFRSLARAIGRYALGYRHRFSLYPTGRQLVLDRERSMLGRVIRSARTVLPLDRLQEITLERAGEPAGFTVGLASLAGGTFLGARFISEGLLAPSMAPSLLGAGSLLILCGVVLDFFVGSGRTPAHRSGRPELTLKVTDERGWVLACFNEPQAENLLQELEHALATGERLPDSAARSEESEPPVLPTPESQATNSGAPPGR